MASVNRVTIIGNAGKDPELRYNPAGVAFCTLTIATSRSWKNKETGEKVEETEWHRVTFNDKLAEIVGQYVKKGKPVYVEGRLKTRKWQDKEGRDTYTTEIIADQMQLLGGKDDAQEPRAPRQATHAPRTHGDRLGGANTRPVAASAGGGFDGFDDECPF